MEKELGTKIWQLFDNFHRFKRKFIKLPELSEVETRILFMVHHNEKKIKHPVNVSILKDILKVSSPTISQIITDLENKDLVFRKQDEKDKRVYRLYISKKGEEQMQIAFKAFQDQFVCLAKHLGEEKCNQLIDIMETVNTYFDKELKL